jgi:16S rRNA (cytosine1402-N4)-methyltransferase
VLDLGVSSMQIDEAERGFSFRFDGPLDMRMDPQAGGQTAADIVNGYDEESLANIIYEYGEERLSRRIARAIVAARAAAPIKRTLQLAEIVRRVVPRSKKDQIDPATRTFQALRIAVNEELEELRAVLIAAERLLREGGRLVVVTFHSLEDALVKKFLAERSGKQSQGSRHLPAAEAGPAPTFALPSSKPVPASASEAASNPRARSAKMRLAVRTAAPAWPVSQGRAA